MSLAIGQTIVTVPVPEILMDAAGPADGFRTEVIAKLSDLDHPFGMLSLRASILADEEEGNSYGFPLDSRSDIVLVRQSGPLSDPIYAVAVEVHHTYGIDETGALQDAVALLVDPYGEQDTIPWDRVHVNAPDDFDVSDFE